MPAEEFAANQQPPTAQVFGRRFSVTRVYASVERVCVQR
jgi:hypothetical protein